MTTRTSIAPSAAQRQIWTSAEVARFFRVGVSSVKRWTDEGELESIRTPGGHRRYRLAAIHRFASLRGLPAEGLPPMAEADQLIEVPPPVDISLYKALTTANAEAIRQLVAPREESLAKRAAFFDRVVGEAMREIGIRWSAGDIGVDVEHRASHMIVEALDRMRPSTKVGAPLALLACPPSELHDLPLRLVRLIFEWSGWRTEFAGASLPWPSARAAVDRAKPTIVALSSRGGDVFQYTEFDRFIDYCEGKKIQVVVGGEWARGGTGRVDKYERFRTLRGFERWLREWMIDHPAPARVR
jgi:excisionase family DNA binding protein